jgi:hypothetical protein
MGSKQSYRSQMGSKLGVITKKNAKNNMVSDIKIKPIKGPPCNQGSCSVVGRCVDTVISCCGNIAFPSHGTYADISPLQGLFRQSDYDNVDDHQKRYKI